MSHFLIIDPITPYVLQSTNSINEMGIYVKEFPLLCQGKIEMRALPAS